LIIVKLRRPFLIPLQFVPYDNPFMWYARVTWDGYSTPSEFSSDFYFNVPELNQKDRVLDSIYVDNVLYAKKQNIVDCQNTEGSFYFDITNQLLYIHVYHDKRMDSSYFSAYDINGYCTETVLYDNDDIEYKPLLASSVSIRKNADRLVYGKLGFINFTFDYSNKDDDFTDFIDNPVPGSDVNVLYISKKEYDSGIRDGIPIYTGYVSEDTYGSDDKYSNSVKDKRAKLSANIPGNRFNSVDFPDISDDVNDKIIPEGYGDIKGATAFCINGIITTGNVNYKYCTDGTSITTVYVKTGDAWNTVTPVSTSPTTGELVLSATDARDSSGNPKQVKVDARFRDIDSPGDIIIDLILRSFNQLYNSGNYNITQWTAESAYLADVYLYMGKQKSFFEYIEELQNASDYGFRFDIDAEGKYTLKVDDINRAVSATYDYVDIISDSLKITRDFEEYATSVRVGYNYDQESGRGTAVVSDSLSYQVFREYSVYQEKQYQSNLKISTDAQNKADRIALDFSKARNQVSFEIEGIEYRQIYDIITVDTSKYIDGVKVREYMGVRKLKLSGIRWDFGNERTELTGYDITDII